MPTQGIHTRDGEVFGYLEGNRTYDLNGNQTGVVRENTIFDLEGNRRWVLDGHALMDLEGQVIGYLSDPAPDAPHY